MKALNTLLIAAAFSFSTAAFAGSPPRTTDHHHVTWTTSKGRAKCCNKKSKAKADACAEKLRSKAATDVNVMAGRCPGK